MQRVIGAVCTERSDEAQTVTTAMSSQRDCYVVTVSEYLSVPHL